MVARAPKTPDKAHKRRVVKKRTALEPKFLSHVFDNHTLPQVPDTMSAPNGELCQPFSLPASHAQSASIPRLIVNGNGAPVPIQNDCVLKVEQVPPVMPLQVSDMPPASDHLGLAE